MSSETRSLDRSLAHGVAWTAGLRAVTQALSWIATLVVARLLSKEDYGLFGMAVMYHGLVQLVNEFGLGSAIVRKRDLSEDQIASLGGISIAFSLLLWGVSALISGLVASFFAEPPVKWLIIALGATFVTTALKVLPRSLLSRDLQFKRVAQIDAIEAVIGTLATLVFAMLGFAYWSLVIGMLIGGMVSSIVARTWRPHRVQWPKEWASIGPAVRFGWHIVVGRLAWYGYSNADFAVVGRVLGTAALGAYTIGWNLASIPVSRVSALVGQVTPGIFSAVQNEPEQLRRYLFKITELIAVVTFPLSFGLALVSPEFVLVVLGEKWRAAIVPLQLLAFYGGFRSITTLLPQVLVSVGQSAEQMRYNLLALFVMAPLFYLGSHWGAGGVAAAWVVGYPLVVTPVYIQVFEATRTNLWGYLGALWPALSSSLLMAAAVFGVHSLVGASLPQVALLSLEVATGALVYVGVMFLVYRERVDAYRSVLRTIRR